MSIILRPCSSTEAGAVLAFWMSADAEPTHTDDVASVVRLIEHDGEALVVAVENGRIVGSVIGAWDGWRGAIYRLAVAPSHRRSGLARRLVADAEDRLRSRGAVRLAAIVVESDPQAVGFWRSSGWEEQTERARFVKG